MTLRSLRTRTAGAISTLLLWKTLPATSLRALRCWLRAPDGINGVNLANASQLSAWTNRTVSNPVDPEEYAAELNKRIEAEGKFPVRE